VAPKLSALQRTATQPCAKAFGPVATMPAISSNPVTALLKNLIRFFWERRDNIGLVSQQLSFGANCRILGVNEQNELGIFPEFRLNPLTSGPAQTNTSRVVTASE
jgi:hypothetical protein